MKIREQERTLYTISTKEERKIKKATSGKKKKKNKKAERKGRAQ
jgi:hypothetical protein